MKIDTKNNDYYHFEIDFREERKVLLELIGPELQSMYDDRQIEVNKH